LIEIARRLMAFGGGHHLAYRLGGDEFAMILADVHSDAEVQRIAAALSQQFTRPIDLHNGSTAVMTLSIGYALTWEHATAESLLELADKNMYQVKQRRSQSSW
jgi:diguanylate cyclase